VTGGGEPHVTPPMTVVRVAVDVPGAPGERLYDYLAGDVTPVTIGDGVIVPFGGRRAIGIVVSLDPTDLPPAGITLKPIEGRLGSAPLVTPLLMSLAESIATRWAAPIATTVRSLLPAGMLDAVVLEACRVGEASEVSARIGLGEEWVAVERLTGARGKTRAATLKSLRQLEQLGEAQRRWSLVRRGAQSLDTTFASLITDAAPAILEAMRLGGRQVAAVEQLTAAARSNDPWIVASALPGGLPTARRLADAGAVQLEVRRVQRRHADRRSASVDAAGVEISLTDVQREIADAACDRSAAGKTILVDGPPGSGKSRAAAEAAVRMIAAGRSVLWLVPEAAQVAIAADMLATAGGVPEPIHSGLSAGERLDAHDRLLEPGPHLVVGTRVALGALRDEVGLVVVDEEHEGAYKCDRTPRLHARDAARELARLAGAATLLLSATPAIETLARAEIEGWRRFTLTRRTPAPLVEVIDLRQELADGWRGMMSRSLLERLTALDWAGGSQALLIINRRGLASALLCRDCGAAQSCPSCERPLVLHSAGSLLRCHGCGIAAEPLTRCPSCGGARIRALGGGTERLEAEVRAALPNVLVDRLDADAASAIGSGDRILDAFRSGRTQILVGTALAAKALDLPALALVGIVSADTGLLLPDERAAERAVALVVQAVGRLGRGTQAGVAVIQSYRPEDPAITAAVEIARGGGVDAWRAREIGLRKAAGGAPFLRTVKVSAAAATAAAARRSIEGLATTLRAAAVAAGDDRARILGPIPAWVPRRAGRWRENLILRAVSIEPYLPLIRGRDLTVDVDPETLL
jgi:primosomal protein N' (replication factor Y) (superfamily II helicase)